MKHKDELNLKLQKDTIMTIHWGHLYSSKKYKDHNFLACVGMALVYVVPYFFLIELLILSQKWQLTLVLKSETSFSNLATQPHWDKALSWPWSICPPTLPSLTFKFLPFDISFLLVSILCLNIPVTFFFKFCF